MDTSICFIVGQGDSWAGTFQTGNYPHPQQWYYLNGPALITEAKEEQTALRDELKAVLDEMVYSALAEKDQAMQESIQNIAIKVPAGIYVG